MVKSHSQTKTRKQINSSRVKSSRCHSKCDSFITCRIRNGCKRTLSGRIKSYCRCRTNRHS